MVRSKIKKKKKGQENIAVTKREKINSREVNNKRIKVNDVKNQTVKLDSTSYSRNVKMQRKQKAQELNNIRRRRRRRKNYTLHFILIFILITVVGISLSFTVFFNIEQITVTGFEEYDKEQVIRSSQAQIGQNMFRLNLNILEKNVIEENLHIDEVKIERVLPKTLNIIITQAVASTTFLYNGEYYIISNNGRIIDKVADLSGYENLFVNIGMDLSSYAVGDFLQEDDTYKIIEKVETAIENAELENIKSIEIYDANQIKLNYDNRITIDLGNILEIDYKLSLSKEVIKSKVGITEEGILDSSTVGKTYFRPISMEEQKKQ